MYFSYLVKCGVRGEGKKQRKKSFQMFLFGELGELDF